ncbi:PQ-loop domain-containing transporter [Bradyrhizobium sp. LA6.1]|uniref:PQ-loop domain-containing transporter n=1 Tax=Bradyrhizobium sp. LA6.1 TaxID=3156378 RepID=UPI00339250F5
MARRGSPERARWPGLLSRRPQVREAWPRGSTEDLSLFMLWALTLGLGFWIVYGAIRLDDRRRERD